MYNSMEENVYRWLPQLFSFKTTYLSSCDSLSCPRQIKEYSAGKTFQSAYLPPFCPKISQDVINSFFMDPLEEVCRLIASDQHRADKPSSHFLPYTPVHLECEATTPEYQCAGTRIYPERSITSLPPIFCITIPVPAVQSERMTAKPVRTIMLGQTAYVVGVVIYSAMNGTHFNCHIIIKGRPLFYDGMRQPKLCWHSLSEYTSTKYPICHVWYVRSTRDTSMIDDIKYDSETSSLGSSEDHNVDDVVSRPVKRIKTGASSSMSKVDIKATLLPQPKKHQKRFPIGISKQVVGSRGALPTCMSCNEIIQRGRMRVVHRYVSNLERGHHAQKSYHAREECLKWMSPEQFKMVAPL